MSMGFPVDEFFSLDEFAVSAVISGLPSAILVIFDSEDYNEELQGMRAANARLSATVKTADIQSIRDSIQGGTMVINGTTYYMMEPLDDGTGITEIPLSKSRVDP